MRLKNKITLLTSVWVIAILLIVDITVYLLFIKLATQNEIDLLQTKSEQMIEKLGPQALIQKKQDRQLQMFIPEDTTIRIINAKAELISFIHNEETVSLPPHKFATKKESELSQENGQKAVIVRVPITIGNQVVGTFEMIEMMDSLNSSINMLITILIISTGGAIVLSFIGGTFLSRTIVKPISKSIQTMQEIESSLIFKRIPSLGHSKDEIFKMTETFNRMMGRLEESFLKQQQFVSDASHELNTTLTIVEGYANMLRRWGTKDQDIQKESIESIYEESKRMRIMTQQLLDLAAAQHGMKLDAQPFDLVDSCTRAAALVKTLHKRTIHINTVGRDPIITADPLKIKQLLLILLDNALKYSGREIELSVSLEDTHAVIRVKDYGIGIPKEEQDLIFERFYRVDQARHRTTGGTGLGLPIAKSIVVDHGGTIRVDSEEGAGTEVTVQLPRGNR
jgi:two-component system sensor histidine kinase ArlS